MNSDRVTYQYYHQHSQPIHKTTFLMLIYPPSHLGFAHVLLCSNVGHEVGYPEWGFLWFPTIPTVISSNVSLKTTKISTFQVLYNSSLTTVICCKIIKEKFCDVGRRMQLPQDSVVVALSIHRVLLPQSHPILLFCHIPRQKIRPLVVVL